MGIALGSNFDVQTDLPLDSRTVVADSTARDAIDALVRYEGLIVYVVADATNYQLVGGIANGDWTEISGSGGGGGISVELFQHTGPAPLVVLYNSEVYEFEDALGVSYLYGTFPVPSSYEAGSPINFKSKFFTSVTSGNVLFHIVATLVKPGTDAASSTTNQHGSINTAVTVNAGTNVVTNFTCDLTNTIGQINSVAVSPGDIINFYIVRETGTDTAAASVYLYREGHEVTIV